jgi:hypothetical protein
MRRKHMKKGIIKAVVLAVLVLFVAGTAWAAQAEAPAKGDAQADNMQIVKEKIKTDKKFLVATNMKLTEKEDKAFWPVYESYQKDLTAVNERALNNIKTYADNADKMTDELSKKVVKEFLTVEKDRLKLKESYLPKFAKVLPYKKVMRYYQLENKIQAIVNYEAAKLVPLVD